MLARPIVGGPTQSVTGQIMTGKRRSQRRSGGRSRLEHSLNGTWTVCLSTFYRRDATAIPLRLPRLGYMACCNSLGQLVTLRVV